MRKLQSKGRAGRVTAAYANDLLRPLGPVLARMAKAEYALTAEPSRIHPVYAWADGADHVHVIAATPAGPVLLALWKSDLAAVLKAPEFSRFQLTPDPFATKRNVEAMTHQGLLPAEWEKGMMNEQTQSP